eukprot:TRINITY_DN3441_c0_g1_i1.p1 TRINITY_DN3441_c0_g1~~TRINITY_DN3441_c0_g1_i1.p1  ORF type:complete len:183 (-),score=86.70 TRINITY_DN3441_c0_g1_i1:153-656(-)
MKFAAVVLLCLAVICVAHRHGHMRGGHEIDAASLSRFEQFMTKYEKSYETHEFHYRFNVFQDNLKKIEALNFLHQGKTTFEANEFADLTDDEFAAIYLRPVDEDVLVAFANEHREAAEPATENIPSNWTGGIKALFPPSRTKDSADLAGLSPPLVSSSLLGTWPATQ